MDATLAVARKLVVYLPWIPQSTRIRSRLCWDWPSYRPLRRRPSLVRKCHV